MDTFRPSQLDSYTRCPTAYYLSVDQKKDQVTWPTSVGNAVHDAAKQFHENGEDPIECTFNNLRAIAEKHPEILEGAQKTRDTDSLMIKEAFEQYMRIFHASDVQQIYCEVPCRMRISFEGDTPGNNPHNFDDFLIEGTLDQVRIDSDGNWQMIDIKTGKKHMGYEGLRRSIQVWAYSYAIWKGELLVDGVWTTINIIPTASYLNFRNLQPYKKSGKWGKKGDYRGSPYSNVSISENGFMQFEKRAQDIVKAIRMKMYPPNPYSCETCFFTKECTTLMELDPNVKEFNKTLSSLEGIG